MIGPAADADEERGIAAWDSIKDLNLIQELASAPYTVLVYLYPRTMGMLDPAQADWVIFIHRGPPPEPPIIVTTIPEPVPVSPLPTAQPFGSPLTTPSP